MLIKDKYVFLFYYYLIGEVWGEIVCKYREWKLRLKGMIKWRKLDIIKSRCFWSVRKKRWKFWGVMILLNVGKVDLRIWNIVLFEKFKCVVFWCDYVLLKIVWLFLMMNWIVRFFVCMLVIFFLMLRLCMMVGVKIIVRFLGDIWYGWLVCLFLLMGVLWIY